MLSKIGLDIDTGLKYCGDMEFYMEVLRISLEASKEKYDSIIRYLDGEDYRSYTIVVHSVKSSCANIGALELSQMARDLEDAGKREDVDYIKEHNEEFLACYRRLIDDLENLFATDDEEKKAEEPGATEAREISAAEWDTMIDRLSYYLQELELDMAEEVLEELKTCNITKDATDLVADISYKLQRFDVEGAREAVNALKGVSAIM